MEVAQEVEPAGGGPAVNIIQGDARRLREWVTGEVHLVVTSPPYNVGIPYNVHDDNLSDEEYRALIADTFAACHAVMAEGARIAVIVPFGLGRDPWAPCAARVAALREGAGFTLRGQIAWDKGTMGNRRKAGWPRSGARGQHGMGIRSLRPLAPHRLVIAFTFPIDKQGLMVIQCVKRPRPRPKQKPSVSPADASGTSFCRDLASAA